MTYKMLGLLVGGLMLVSAGTASAAQVSVEIEGKTVIKAPTAVYTSGAVSKPGGAACSGPVPATALETAVAGNWDGPSYGVTRIQGEEHPFVSGGSSWAVYVNGSFINDTVCDHALADGDKVLFFWSDAFASEGFDEPVLLDAPTTARPGQAFTVTAKDVTTDFSTFPSPPSAQTPAAGATVSGGTAPVTTGADGTASVTVGAGPYTLVVTHANRAPARVEGCATTGSDGLCGTSKPPVEVCPATASCAAPPDKTAALSRIQGVTEGKKYAKGKGPRQLAGRTDNEPSGIADTRLRLTRNDGGDCATYDARSEKFKTLKKCGATHGLWFSVGNKLDWSYLLPSKLGRGRYVLDVEVTDRAGNTTTQLARGTSRVVFTVA